MRDQKTNYIVAGLIALVALSTGIDKIYSSTLPGNLSVSLQTIVAVIASLYAVYSLLANASSRINFSLLSLLLLLLSYFIFSTMRSEQIDRSLTYISMLSMSLVVFVVIAMKLNDKTLQISNRLIYLFGAPVILALFSRYAYLILYESSNIISSRELWEIGSSDVYEVEYGQYIAFQGLAGDPNLIGSATAIILFCGLSVKFRRMNIIRHLINLLLIAVIFSSFSRGAISALAATFVITVYLTGNKQYRHYLVIMCAIFVSGYIWMTVAGQNSTNPLGKFSQDFTRRFSEWGALINSIEANPIFGCGLRCDEAKLGKYAENSYIGILVNVGLVGAALYYGLILFVYYNFVSRIKEIIKCYENALPWFSYTTYLILVMWFVSMDVKIHFWTALAVLSAFSIYMKPFRSEKLSSDTN